MATSTSSPVSIVPKRDRREDVVDQIVGELARRPGATMTSHDVERRWRLDPSTCAQVLEALTADELLLSHADGTYSCAPAGREALRRSGAAPAIVWLIVSLGLIGTEVVASLR